MKNEADRNMPCYLGVNDAGDVVSACVDNPAHKNDTAKFVGGLIKDGLTVVRCRVGDLWDGRVKLYEKLPPGFTYERLPEPAPLLAK